MLPRLATSTSSYILKEGWIPNVLITHKEIPSAGISLLKEKCNVVVPEKVPPSREEILKLSAGIDGILWATSEKLDAEVFDAAGPQLKAISVMTAGVDYVDLNEFKKRNIPLGHTPHVVNSSTADIAIGLMIAAGRRFHEGRLTIKRSEWEFHPEFLLGQDVTNATIGIVGFGNIGKAIAKRLQGFDYGTILYTSRSEKEEAAKNYNAKYVPLDELIKQSDFVIIALSLTAETKGLFNLDVFKKMKPTSVLINIGRGAIVNTNDLVHALTNKIIFAAGLDVVDPEPLPSDHPLLDLPNCVIVPHLGTATYEAMSAMSLLAAHNILCGLAEQPLLASVPEM